MNDNTTPERPRFEPEIIPPDHDGRGYDRRYSPWDGSVFGASRGTHRVFVTRLGPLSLVMAMLALAAIIAVVMIAFVGALLVWIPLIAAVVVVAAGLRLWRRFGLR